jgi:hypothetical protein
LGAGVFLLAAREVVQRQTGEDCEAAEGWLPRAARHKKDQKKKDQRQENGRCNSVA